MTITAKIDLLRRQKAAAENRDISIRTVAEESGLAINTIQRLRNGKTERVSFDTLNALCKYFGVKEIGQLLEYKPDPAAKGDEP